MILSRRFVSKFGTTLCVVPVWFFVSSVATAQQGNYQADQYSQMQAMQREIAELRDMIERQEYQIKQLQNGIQNPANGQNDLIGLGNSDLGSSNLPIYQGAVNQDGVDDINEAAVYGEAGTISDPTGLNQNGQTIPGNYPPVLDEGVQSGQQAYQQTYQEPLPAVSDQAISEPALVPPVSNSSGGAPVEERSIGASIPVYDPETYNQPVNQGVNQTPTIGSVPIDSVPVEQIPTTSSPDFPTPYERTVPARQPIENNLPQVNPEPGGVIRVPSQSAAVVGDSQTVDNGAPDSVSSAQSNTPSDEEQGQYQKGFGLLKESKHEEAVAIFKQQITDYPSGEYSDDAHYWIAESLYVNRDLDESKLYFRAIADNYPQSPRVPDAMLKTAYIEQEQGNKIEARILLQEIIQFHPRSNAAISAKNRLADLE